MEVIIKYISNDLVILDLGCFENTIKKYNSISFLKFLKNILSNLHYIKKVLIKSDLFHIFIKNRKIFLNLDYKNLFSVYHFTVVFVTEKGISYPYYFHQSLFTFINTMKLEIKNRIEDKLKKLYINFDLLYVEIFLDECGLEKLKQCFGFYKDED